MDFSEAWDALSIGDRVRVSNGKPCPTENEQGIPYMAWRSHNFDGTLIEKTNGTFRTMKVEMDPTASAVIAYTLREGAGHSFTAISA